MLEKHLSLKDRNVVKTVRWVWEDSSLSVFIVGSGTILMSFKSGCNMNSTNPRICFIVYTWICPGSVHLKWQVGALPIKSIIFGASWEFLKVSNRLWKTGSNIEHFREISKTAIYLRWVGQILTRTYATRNIHHRHFQISCAQNYMLICQTWDTQHIPPSYQTNTSDTTASFPSACHWSFRSQPKGRTGPWRIVT